MEPILVSVPKAWPDPLPKLEVYLEPFAPLFQRSQSRQSLERYITGLLTDLERKNCDTIAAAVAGTSTEQLQHLLTDAGWDATVLDRERVHRLVEKSPQGVSWSWTTLACPSRARLRRGWLGSTREPWAR